MNKTKILLNIVGPTAIGKTALAIRLAQEFQTEIISSDARQFYKEMQIGTAVPSKEELAAVSHHFIQHISIKQPYSVGDFRRDALLKLDSLFKKNKIVIMVGGSGLYADALVYGLHDFPEIPEQIRIQLNAELEEKGLEFLQESLKKRDPEIYKRIAIENPRRVIRALEVCLVSGKPYSSFISTAKKENSFKTLTVGLTADRSIIYQRINQRVEIMMEKGLEKEAKKLHPEKKLNALQTVGYKELFAFFEGKHSLAVATEEIKKNTRRFAKRQLTWYQKRKDVLWITQSEEFKTVHTKISDVMSML